MEDGLRNAAATLLGENQNARADLKVCWFHVLQAIRRKMGDGMSKANFYCNFPQK